MAQEPLRNQGGGGGRGGESAAEAYAYIAQAQEGFPCEATPQNQEGLVNPVRCLMDLATIKAIAGETRDVVQRMERCVFGNGGPGILTRIEIVEEKVEDAATDARDWSAWKLALASAIGSGMFVALATWLLGKI